MSLQRGIRLDGRVALVTGAGGGLGRSHALDLAKRGASLLVNDVGASLDGAGNDAGPGQAVVDEILAAGGRAVLSTDSVAEPAGGDAMVHAALDAFGRLDVIVHNAGILRDVAAHKLTPEDIRAVVDVHLLGAFWVTIPALRVMRDQRFGRLIYTTSAAGLFGNFGQANYAAAKMGLVGLVKTLSLEGAKHGIRANAIAPNARTRMTEALASDIAIDLDPTLVSGVVVWLASEECAVTGEVVCCGGGRLAVAAVGESDGVVLPALTPEAARDAWDAAAALDALSFPRSAHEEIVASVQKVTAAITRP